MERVSDDIETLVWIDGKGRPRITQTIKSEKTVEFEIMDRVSDKELWALIQVAGKHPNYLLHEKFWDTIVSAFTELRERRAAEHGVVHFKWQCRCGHVNVWSWLKAEYCKWVPTMMECDECEAETMMHTRPEVIHDALRRDGDRG